MASPFEIDDELDMNEAGDISDYDGLFDEEDFIALGINPGAPTAAKPGSLRSVRRACRRSSFMPCSPGRWLAFPGRPASTRKVRYRSRSGRRIKCSMRSVSITRAPISSVRDRGAHLAPSWPWRKERPLSAKRRRRVLPE